MSNISRVDCDAGYDSASIRDIRELKELSLRTAVSKELVEGLLPHEYVQQAKVRLANKLLPYIGYNVIYNKETREYIIDCFVNIIPPEYRSVHIHKRKEKIYEK